MPKAACAWTNALWCYVSEAAAGRLRKGDQTQAMRALHRLQNFLEFDRVLGPVLLTRSHYRNVK